MGQVSVTVNGRVYRLECGAGEEKHLMSLAEFVSGHVEAMRKKFGQAGDDRLILMAALLVADELWEQKRQLASAKAEAARMREGHAADRRAQSRSDVTGVIDAAATRLDSLRAKFADGPTQPPPVPGKKGK